MVKGYGNTRDPAPKTRSVDDDLPHPQKSITRKILETLPPVKRDTPVNRRMAKNRGWTDEEFEAWVHGEADDDSGVREG